jgi:hypothetical protein
LYEVSGAIGAGASSEQPKNRAVKPIKPKERSVFFMIYKYSLQKDIVVAKTFLLSLGSL